MDVRVFVSSTSKDLTHKSAERDCRRCAERAILSAGAEPVMSQRWVTAFGSVVEVCKQKLIESTHYLGIIGYRYGFQPKGICKSITQAEFEWACEHRRPDDIAILVPDPASLFAARLKTRARDQTKSEHSAQEAFREAIFDAGVYMPFDDAIDLALKVSGQVRMWKEGGLAPFAARLGGARKRSNKVIYLGRRQQMGLFADALELLETAPVPRVAAFVVHGPDGFGHDEMVQRMRQRVRDGDDEPEYRYADIDPGWSKTDLNRLVKALRLGETREALAAQLERRLANSDVIIDIGNVQRFAGSLPKLLESFWKPVAASLKARLPNRLIVFFRVEEQAPKGWDVHMQARPPETSDEYDAARPFKLPALCAFKEEELSAWLTNKVPADRVAVLARTLMRETRGLPVSVFNKLRGTMAS